MKSGTIIFNSILLVLIGVLFYLHFTSNGKTKGATAAAVKSNNNVATANEDFKIAYFEMDSLEASFTMFKDVKSELDRRGDAVNAELARMEKNYKEKLDRYQGQAAGMTQVQSEMATKDMMQMQQQMQSRKQALDQEYQDLYMRRYKDVKNKIEAFLKEYNTEKKYTYIFAYEPGLFYYRDTVYDITSDVIRGLNENYKKK